MKGILVNQKMNRQFVVRLCIACVWLALGVVPSAAESGESKKGSASTSQKNSDLSTDNLQKEISDLDSQIQKLREQPRSPNFLGLPCFA